MSDAAARSVWTKMGGPVAKAGGPSPTEAILPTGRPATADQMEEMLSDGMDVGDIPIVPGGSADAVAASHQMANQLSNLGMMSPQQRAQYVADSLAARGNPTAAPLDPADFDGAEATHEDGLGSLDSTVEIGGQTMTQAQFDAARRPLTSAPPNAVSGDEDGIGSLDDYHANDGPPGGYTDDIGDVSAVVARERAAALAEQARMTSQSPLRESGPRDLPPRAPLPRNPPTATTPEQQAILDALNAVDPANPPDDAMFDDFLDAARAAGFTVAGSPGGPMVVQPPAPGTPERAALDAMVQTGNPQVIADQLLHGQPAPIGPNDVDLTGILSIDDPAERLQAMLSAIDPTLAQEYAADRAARAVAPLDQSSFDAAHGVDSAWLAGSDDDDDDPTALDEGLGSLDDIDGANTTAPTSLAPDVDGEVIDTGTDAIHPTVKVEPTHSNPALPAGLHYTVLHTLGRDDLDDISWVPFLVVGHTDPAFVENHTENSMPAQIATAFVTAMEGKFGEDWQDHPNWEDSWIRTLEANGYVVVETNGLSFVGGNA